MTPGIPPLTSSVLDDLGFEANDGTWDINRTKPSYPREPEAATAWSALLGQRRLQEPPRDDRPALWETEQPARAVALALEAAGHQPAARDEYGRWARDGYCVEESTQPGHARVTVKPRREWTSVGNEEYRSASQLYSWSLQNLMMFEMTLEEHGWSIRRSSSSPYLIVSPLRD
ncbi:hypothetical protein [Streptomyces sp. cg35]|uniref:hypothetical protein n=1 Tax=Streptomyces sp. cg35 TaxID=3421650 RepID=UPI003D179F35